MIGLIVILVVVVAAGLVSVLGDAPERRLEHRPRGWYPSSRRR